VQISSISQSNSVNFSAKFLQTDDLKRIAEYAIEHGKYDELNKSRKEIESLYLLTKLGVYVGEASNGHPMIEFVKYIPRRNVTFAQYENDYTISKPVIFSSSNKNKNPMEYALKILIKMGRDVPNNRVFRRVLKGD